MRFRYLRWGATDREVGDSLPGDDLIPDADMIATRAITIHAAADHVWPWIAQLGQGRGGFYSYDLLENLVGCNIHSSNRIRLEWQDIKVGDEIKLAPQVGLRVALVEQGRSLVLRGGIPMRKRAAPYDFTWAFTLRHDPDETTRLLVRERYVYTQAWARLIVEPTELLSFAMSQKMLRGIRDRAERNAVGSSEGIATRHALKRSSRRESRHHASAFSVLNDSGERPGCQPAKELWATSDVFQRRGGNPHVVTPEPSERVI